MSNPIRAEYVYALSNTAMPGLFKIGWTTRTPEERARELQTTGVPGRFIVEESIQVPSGRRIEQILHAQFEDRRWADNREFFRISREELREVFALIDAEADSFDFSALVDAAVDILEDRYTPDKSRAFELLDQAVAGGNLDAAAIGMEALADDGRPSARQAFERYAFKLVKSGDPRGHEGLIERYLIQGNFEEAAREVQEYLKRIPDLLRIRGFLLDLLGRRPKPEQVTARSGQAYQIFFRGMESTLVSWVEEMEIGSDEEAELLLRTLHDGEVKYTQAVAGKVLDYLETQLFANSALGVSARLAWSLGSSPFEPLLKRALAVVARELNDDSRTWTISDAISLLLMVEALTTVNGQPRYGYRIPFPPTVTWQSPGIRSIERLSQSQSQSGGEVDSIFGQYYTNHFVPLIKQLPKRAPSQDPQEDPFQKWRQQSQRAVDRLRVEAPKAAATAQGFVNSVAQAWQENADKSAVQETQEGTNQELEGKGAVRSPDDQRPGADLVGQTVTAGVKALKVVEGLFRSRK